MQDSDPQRKKTREGKACWFPVGKEITGRACSTCRGEETEDRVWEGQCAWNFYSAV